MKDDGGPKFEGQAVPGAGSYWRRHAAPIIAGILARGLEPKEERRALIDAYPFGERKMWPYKVWLDEVARQRGRKPPLGTKRLRPDAPGQTRAFE